MKDRVQELLKKTEIEQKKTAISPRKFESKDGKTILNQSKPFDKDWYKNDKSYDVL